MEYIKQNSLQTTVYELLKNMIERGEFTDGMMPSEHKLSKKLGVSRTTLRSALTSLEGEGYIIKKHGVGTYVNRNINRINIQINKGVGYFDLLRKAGHNPSILYTKVKKLNADYQNARVLKIQEGDEYYKIERVFCANEVPAIYIEENISIKNISQHFKISDIPDSIFVFAERFCIQPIEFTIVDIIPYVADKKLVKKLNCASNENILLTKETHLSSNSDILIYSNVYSRDRFVRFQVLRTP